jgi:hypothetical protein
LGVPCQLGVLAGPEHGRTIPLAVVRRAGLLASLSSKPLLIQKFLSSCWTIAQLRQAAFDWMRNRRE